MIPYGKQFIDQDDIDEVVKTLKSDFLTQGPKIAEFEKNFAERVRSKYAVAVSNGTAALHISCLSLGLTTGDNVITTPMTFAASSNCARYCGASVQFADITANGLIDPKEIKKKIDKKTKILIPVDYSGHPCEWEQIKEISSQNNIKIIEDACHALGAKYKGSTIGDCKYSDMTVFSFHPVKHITTGEGGMITTNSKDLYEKLSTFRTHGITKDPNKLILKNQGTWYHEMQDLGYNYRITDIQAALGISQLKKLDGFVKRRREIARLYDDAFQESVEFTTIKEPANCESSYHLYPILLKDKFTIKKVEIFNLMRQNGITFQVHYIPVYFHPYYQNLGFKKGLCPKAEDFYQREFSIPMYPLMTPEDVQTVIQQLNKII